MSLKTYLLPALFFLISFSAAAQQISQQLYGKVRSEESLQPVAGAFLILKGNEQNFQAVTDSSGNYRFEALQPGRYQLQVSHISFKSKVIPEILVKASRPEILAVYLEESELLLQEAEVRSGLPAVQGNIGRMVFTIEETQRFPATFFDPARLLRSQPGITAANDQTNQISVHGQSPNHVAWQIGGVEIVSPNHLPNAGNATDRSAMSGGGVNILSGQLLDNSYFYTGSLPATLGNAVGGIFDINLRPGSRTQYSHTLQASLLGIDLATEGPLKKAHTSLTTAILQWAFSASLA